MEDVAVAYGFDNLPRRFPSTNTVAAPLPINKLSDLVRRDIAYAGWIEALSLILVSAVEAVLLPRPLHAKADPFFLLFTSTCSARMTKPTLT
jgi:phenylalanyl-tRNA synthetase beta subunit